MIARDGRAPRVVRGGGRLAAAIARVLTYRPDVDGRLLVVAVVAAYLAAVAICRWFGVDIWPSLGVPSGPSLFFDTRNLTAALECRRLGFDPLIESPCDPWGRPLVYPRVWLALRWLGIDQSHTDILALLFIALFFASVLVVVGRVGLGPGIVVSVAVCSPSVMFAVERANMDIVIFSLLVAAVVVWRSRAPWAAGAAPLLTFVAATAKLYPAFGLPAYLLMRRRPAAVASLVLSVLFVVYVVATLRDIQAVTAVAPQGVEHSFGVRILPVAIYHAFVSDRWAGGQVLKQLVAVIPLLVVIPVVWMYGRRLLPPTDPDADSSVRLAFYLGALVFLGTFAAGNNFDYRLVFVLLMLPQLFAWASGADLRRGLAAASLVAVLGLLWIGALSGPLHLADEIVTWVVAGLVVAMLAASVPSVASVWRGVRSSEETSAAHG